MAPRYADAPSMRPFPRGGIQAPCGVRKPRGAPRTSCARLPRCPWCARTVSQASAPALGALRSAPMVRRWRGPSSLRALRADGSARASLDAPPRAVLACALAVRGSAARAYRHGPARPRLACYARLLAGPFSGSCSRRSDGSAHARRLARATVRRVPDLATPWSGRALARASDARAFSWGHPRPPQASPAC
jgi:hypothetical protein